MSSRSLRTSAALLVLLSPACVVRLSERNSPLANGGVTGPQADCSAVQVPPVGAPGGAAATNFVGRYDETKLKPPELLPHRFDWSGNSMSARFEGTDVTWGAVSGKEQVFEVIIDGKAQQVVRPDFLIADVNERTMSRHKVPAGVHEITVIRSSEAQHGASYFIDFQFPGGKVLPPTRYARRIEYIGDSITCGYGNEGGNATCPYDVVIRQEPSLETPTEVVDVKIPETQNIYLAYGSIAARKLSAEATTLCYSGKGMVRNYRERGVGIGKVLFPKDEPDEDAKTTIPLYYRRTLANDHPVVNPEDPDDRPGVDWPFKEVDPPQVVVINVGTNDFARDVDHDTIAEPLDVAAFRDGYLAFVREVRKERAAAHIFIAVPPMVTDLFPLENARTDFRNALRSIVDELSASGDTKVYAIELVEQGVRYGLGCDYHPNLEVHRIMADQLVGAIKSKTCWSTVEAK